MAARVAYQAPDARGGGFFYCRCGFRGRAALALAFTKGVFGSVGRSSATAALQRARNAVLVNFCGCAKPELIKIGLGHDALFVLYGGRMKHCFTLSKTIKNSRPKLDTRTHGKNSIASTRLAGADGPTACAGVVQ